MNSTNKVIGIITLSLLLTGCGKEAVNKDSLKSSIAPTEAEIYFHGYQDVKNALFNNDFEEFKSVLERFPEIKINEVMTEGETFLTYAIKNDFIEIRNYLLENGANINRTNINKESPLFVAVVYDRLNSIQRLFDLKADLNLKDINGNTALHLAIKKNKDEIAAQLINAGAKLEITDKNGKSALKLAQEYDVPVTLNLIMVLLNMEQGVPDLASFRALLENADYKSLTKVLDRYPYLLKESVYDSVNPFSILLDVTNEPHAIKSAEVLINNHANVDGPETSVQTPLIKAVLRKRKIFANILLSANANPQYIDEAGKSALIHAIEKNDFDLVNLLISYSAMEKYTVRINDKKITYNACDVAKKTAKDLKSSDDKNTSERIRKLLGCGFWNWLFG